VRAALPRVIERVGSADVIVDVIGDGLAKPALADLAGQLNLQSRVTFHGWKTLPQMRLIVRAGDIGLCIMPPERTTAACSNQKVFQYQAMSLSIIATRVGDLPLYLKNGAAGLLIDENDSAEIAAAISRLIESQHEREKLAAAGHTLSQTEFDWKTLSLKLSEFIKSQAAISATSATENRVQ